MKIPLTEEYGYNLFCLGTDTCYNTRQCVSGLIRRPRSIGSMYFFLSSISINYTKGFADISQNTHVAKKETFTVNELDSFRKYPKHLMQVDVAGRLHCTLKCLYNLQSKQLLHDEMPSGNAQLQTHTSPFNLPKHIQLLMAAYCSEERYRYQTLHLRTQVYYSNTQLGKTINAVINKKRYHYKYCQEDLDHVITMQRSGWLL